MYKGQISNFPTEIVEKMLEYQDEQGNKLDVTVFEDDKMSGITGFVWEDTPEGFHFWDDVIADENFDRFFEQYPRVETTTQLTVDFGHSYSSIAASMVANLTISGVADEWVNGVPNKVIFTFETAHISLVKLVLDRMGLSYE